MSAKPPTEAEKRAEARRKAKHSKELRRQLRQSMTTDPTVKHLERKLGKSRAQEHGDPSTPVIEGKEGMLLREITKKKRKTRMT